MNESSYVPIKWTDLAIACYKRGCRCEGCEIPPLIESKCQMKYAVIELVRLYGVPPEKKEIDFNKIYELASQGMQLKDIAEEMGLTMNQLTPHTQAMGINGFDLRGGYNTERKTKRGKR